jgi:hypothetical protein
MAAPAFGGWLGGHWWLLWALFAVSALVAYRLRRDGGEGSLPRRIASALFSFSAKDSQRREVTALMIVLVFSGVVLVAVAAGLVALPGP